MKYPYAVNRTRIIQTQIEYDDENIEQSSTTVENNTAAFLELLLLSQVKSVKKPKKRQNLLMLHK